MAVSLQRAILIALACVALSACGQKAEPAASGAAANAASAGLAVTLAHAQQRPIERSVIASGPVAAWEEMQLGVELNGMRVTALHVDVGQQVRKGDVLLEIDHRTLDSDLRQAQAAVVEAQAEVELAKANLARGEMMVRKQLVSASSWDSLKAAKAQADARLSTAMAQRDGAQLRRDYAALRAPDDGVISRRMVEPGQVVMAGGELLRLIRQGRLEWRPELPAADLAKVTVGAHVVLHDANGKTIDGRVRAVSPGVDTATRTGVIHVDLPEPGALKAGTFVEGRIVTSTSNGLMVPSAAIVVRDGYPYVFTVDPAGTAHRLRVRTGASANGEVEVVEGLQQGQAVVATGAGFLGDGDHVRIVDAPAASAAAGQAGVAR